MIRMDTPWLIGRHDAQEERNQMHLTAIREARITTEYRAAMAEAGAVAPGRRGSLATGGRRSTADLATNCA